MLISYVIRLRPDALEEGHFVGEIEAVSTRVRSAFRSVQQATAFILSTSSVHAPPNGEPAEPLDAVVVEPEGTHGAVGTSPAGAPITAAPLAPALEPPSIVRSYQ